MGYPFVTIVAYALLYAAAPSCQSSHALGQECLIAAGRPPSPNAQPVGPGLRGTQARDTGAHLLIPLLSGCTLWCGSPFGTALHCSASST